MYNTAIKNAKRFSAKTITTPRVTEDREFPK